MAEQNIVIIGVSTGGPKAIRKLFLDMPPVSASILLVQHMPRFVNEPVREILACLTEMRVKIARNGDRLEPATVYVAPSEEHLELAGNRRIRLTDGPNVCFVRPSVDVAMKSLRAKRGQDLVGIVLTGMGKDGAEGISHMKKIGATTIAQDKDSSAIYSMPKAAQDTGCVDFVMDPEAIQEKLIELVGVVEPEAAANV